MVSPTGRGTPRSETSTPRKILPPPTTTPSSTPSLALRREIAGQAFDSRLVDAETVAGRQRFAGQFDDHATIDRVTHALRSPIIFARMTK